jgi:SAM-dependent methyltransferase
MKKLLSIVGSASKKPKRNYLGRMINNKPYCMKIAGEYGKYYWDGDKAYGYGGYKNEEKWKIIAKKLIQKYHLNNKSKILEVGCGKGYLIYEMRNLLPKATFVGYDFSDYAIKNAARGIKTSLHFHKAETRYQFKKKYFNLVISISTLQDLAITGIISALKEIERVGKNKYIAVDSFRTDRELFNLECWSLTTKSFLGPDDWKWIFKQCGYCGDYEFLYLS